MGRILVACEFSGVVRRAFRALGHDAYSCDLLPAEDGETAWHFQDDVRNRLTWTHWDLLIAHPPCTYLSRAGARWWKAPEREEKAHAAAEFARLLYDCSIPRVAVENPIGQLNRLWRYPDQTIQPFEFGEPYSKATCLWLKGLPPLFATVSVDNYEPWVVSNASARKRAGLPRRATVTSARDASRTFPGIAKAMADQWGAFISAGRLAA